MHPFAYGILGGALIGLAASVLLLFTGQILGASGLARSVFVSPIKAVTDPSEHWRLVVMASFTLTAHVFFTDIYEDKDNGLAKISPLAFAIGGLFVGFGTQLGNGCTSGHGICGLGRLSKRSLVAVCTFMATGILTTYLTQYETTPFRKEALSFLRTEQGEDTIPKWDTLSAVIIFFLCLAAFIAPTFHGDHAPLDERRKLAPAAVVGVLFCTGLYVGRMVYVSVVQGFLNIGLLASGGENWDATLIFVMGGGLAISFLSYQFVRGYNHLVDNRYTISKPIALSEGCSFSVPTNNTIDVNLVVGAACFGIGWGLTGLCPAPAVFIASVGASWVLVCYWPAFIVGSVLATQLKQWQSRNTTSSETDEDSHRQGKDTWQQDCGGHEPTTAFEVSDDE